MNLVSRALRFPRPVLDVRAMRLGVLDVGSNTVHLLVVDAHPGAHPNPMHSAKTHLRLTEHLEAGRLTEAGVRGLVRAVARAGTSKTFRSLARLAGAAPPSAGLRARRVLTDAGLRRVFAFISRMASPDLGRLDGVSAARADQLVAGALVAGAAMRALGVHELQICPWALREGVILRRLDTLGVPTHSQGRGISIAR